MTKHKNLSIFVPHEGCPNQCSFCDQKKISGTQNPPSPLEVISLCDKFLPYDKEEGKSYEIAFFGGSFTAINHDYMVALLEAAYPFVKSGRASGIRVSTRPDAINDEILSVLKQYGVTAIELGAQSMQNDVLKMNLRGHTVQDVFDAGNMIKKWRFSLGLQMMPGLYGQKDYMSYAIDTAEKFIAIKPDTVRIYPTITLKDTLLEKLYQKGIYTPPTLDEMVKICAVLVKMFNDNNIRIIKLGLHADSGIEKNMIAGPYHPAINELVHSYIMLQEFKTELLKREKGNYIIYVNPHKHSQAVGQKKSNIKQLSALGYNVIVKDDNSLCDNKVKIILEGEKQCI